MRRIVKKCLPAFFCLGLVGCKSAPTSSDTKSIYHTDRDLYSPTHDQATKTAIRDVNGKEVVADCGYSYQSSFIKFACKMTKVGAPTASAVDLCLYHHGTKKSSWDKDYSGSTWLVWGQAREASRLDNKPNQLDHGQPPVPWKETYTEAIDSTASVKKISGVEIHDQHSVSGLEGYGNGFDELAQSKVSITIPVATPGQSTLTWYTRNYANLTATGNADKTEQYSLDCQQTGRFYGE